MTFKSLNHLQSSLSAHHHHRIPTTTTTTTTPPPPLPLAHQLYVKQIMLGKMPSRCVLTGWKDLAWCFFRHDIILMLEWYQCVSRLETAAVKQRLLCASNLCCWLWKHSLACSSLTVCSFWFALHSIRQTPHNITASFYVAYRCTIVRA